MPEQNKITRPDPVPTQVSKFFWEALNREELCIQQCAQCQTFLHPPRPMCPHCHSLEHEYVKVDGQATLYSWCLPRHPQLPMFQYPLITALVDLPGGVRLLTNLTDCDASDLVAEMALEVYFTDTAGGKKIHQFRPA